MPSEWKEKLNFKIKNNYKMYSYCEQNFKPSLKSGIYEIDLKYKSKKNVLW